MTERPTLVLVPGLLCEAGLWRHQVADLAEAADVVVSDVSRSGSMAGLAADVLAAAPGRFGLAGLSMGGYVCLEVVRQAPQRVERLALLDTSARPQPPEGMPQRRHLMQLARDGRLAQVVDELWEAVVDPCRHADAALRAEFEAMAERVGPTTFIRQQEAIIARPDSRPDLGGIACPTLVLVGDHDAVTPPALSREMASAIPGAELVSVADCGHLATLERPDEVSAALASWLGR